MQITPHTNPKSLPLDSHGKRGWSNSLFGCFSDCGTCRFSQIVFVFHGRGSPFVTGLTAAFCPCIVYSKINTRLSHLSNRGSPHSSGGDACGGVCFGYMPSLVALVSLVFWRSICRWSTISVVRETNHRTGDPTGQHS